MFCILSFISKSIICLLFYYVSLIPFVLLLRFTSGYVIVNGNIIYHVTDPTQYLETNRRCCEESRRLGC
jgi:hypothetical protein